MNYLVRDAIVGLAMDEAFWAKNPGMTKVAREGAGDPGAVNTGPDDAGFITIGGVRVPRSVVYGLALGGLGGGLGGVAGGVDGKTLALLALLGAAGGGALGYGSHVIDRNTASGGEGSPDRVTAREQSAAEKAAHNAATQKAGLFSNVANLAMGNPIPSVSATGLGLGAQAVGGYMLLAGAQAGRRASKLNDLLETARAVDPVDDKGRPLLVSEEYVDPASGRTLKRTRPAPQIPRASNDEAINALLGFKRDASKKSISGLGVKFKSSAPDAPKPGSYSELAEFAEHVQNNKVNRPAGENWMRGKIRDLRSKLQPYAIGDAGLVTNRPRAGDFATEAPISGLISRGLGRPGMRENVPVEVRDALKRNFGIFGKRNIGGGLLGAVGALVLPSLVGLGPAHSAFSRPDVTALGLKK